MPTLLTHMALGLLPFSPAFDTQVIRVTPARVSAESPRDIASAQVPLGFWHPLEGSQEKWSHRFDWHGESVALMLHRPTPGETLVLSRVDWEAPPVEVEISQAFGEADLRPFGIEAQLMFFQREAGLQSTIRTLYHHEATTAINGVSFTIAWIDTDLDGGPSLGDRWVATEGPHWETLSLANLMFLGNHGDEPWYVEGLGLRMMGPVRDGTVNLSLAAEKLTRSAFLAKRAGRISAEYEEWFDAERAQFLGQYGIDTERALRNEPLRWYYTFDLKDAQAYAQRLGKPLYVEITSDSCPWCKRLEWLNYKDKEVADLLQGYALVKLYRDLDKERSAEKLGLEGVPYAVVFAEDGQPKHIKQGWSPPSEQAAELRRWQAGE